MAAQFARVCYVHIGTHKTGTTALQRTLAERVFVDGELYFPHAGRADSLSGHHNIAWELNGDSRFDPARGTLSELLTEIAGRRAARVCVSSEDFEFLYAQPDRMRALAGGLRGIGYEPIVVIYLRPQAAYAESLYAELVKHGLSATFEEFLNAVLDTGEFRCNGCWCYVFDYERLADGFGAVFGTANVVTRRYDARPLDIVDNFFGIIDAPSRPRGRRRPAQSRLNRSLRFADVLSRWEGNAAARAGRAPQRRLPISAAAGRFDPVHLPEALRVVRRFNGSNRGLQAKYGTRVPCVSGQDLLHDLCAAMGLDPAASYRRALTRTQPAPAPPSVRRIAQRLAASPFRRPALLEAITVVTAASVAALSLLFGGRTARTSLVEFGMLSIVAAASAAITMIRYTVEAQGIIADDAFLREWGIRLRAAAFAAIGLYACANAVLDIALTRYQPDWISYPGAFAAAIAALVFSLLFPVKRRLAQHAMRGTDVRPVRLERAYLWCVYIAAAFEVLHAIAPVWWLDTSADVVVTALVLLSIAGLRRQAQPAVRGMPA